MFARRSLKSNDEVFERDQSLLSLIIVVGSFSGAVALYAAGWWVFFGDTDAGWITLGGAAIAWVCYFLIGSVKERMIRRIIAMNNAEIPWKKALVVIDGSMQCALVIDLDRIDTQTFDAFYDTARRELGYPLAFEVDKGRLYVYRTTEDQASPQNDNT